MSLKARLADLQGLKSVKFILEQEILNQSVSGMEHEDIRAIVLVNILMFS
jgi:hypothetical protein